MATIGYGNIVPVTSSGRIACVIFALFGVPLAIITIGDLGKFLSECTIWLYSMMKKSHASLKRYFTNLKLIAASLFFFSICLYMYVFSNHKVET
uniref:Ion_trans_2 domain-containing protein n=1 Tax=Elaeophora elaphi TaxID=1147741 RepID=A0A0R3S1V2_9BILA